MVVNMSRPPASSESVRRRMQATRSIDTPPEVALRSELHRLGLRFRLHRELIPGFRRKVDIVFFRARVAVFVDGCFWHGCPLHGTLPKSTHRDFWAEKIDRNRRRDRDTNRRLETLGWLVIRVWEHEKPKAAAEYIAHEVGKHYRNPP